MAAPPLEMKCLVPLMTYSSPCSLGVGLDGLARLVVQEVGVGAGVRLGAAEPDEIGVVLEELGQELVPLLGVELMHQPRRLRVAAPDDAGETVVGRTQFQQDDGERGVVGAFAAPVFGNGCRAQTQFGGLLEKVPGDAVFGLLLLVEFEGGRFDFVLGEVADHVPRHFLHVGQSKIHACSFCVVVQVT